MKDVGSWRCQEICSAFRLRDAAAERVRQRVPELRELVSRLIYRLKYLAPTEDEVMEHPQNQPQ
jgi:hypothetical protein